MVDIIKIIEPLGFLIQDKSNTCTTIILGYEESNKAPAYVFTYIVVDTEKDGYDCKLHEALKQEVHRRLAEEYITPIGEIKYIFARPKK